MDEFLYEQNIKNMKNFFNSDLFEQLVEEHNKAKSIDEKFDIVNKVKNIINCWWVEENKFYQEKKSNNSIKIYYDPDDFDKKLYENIKDRYKVLKEYEIKKYAWYVFEKNDIRLALDCVIGWKAIINILYSKNKKIEDIKEVETIYDTIRNPKNNGHLIWPKHTNSINQKRYSCFKDRVDYALYDIKKYYESNGNEEDYRLKISYQEPNTKEWLKDSFGNFKSFIEQMDLEDWCIGKKDENGEVINYDVIDLSQDILKPKPIKDYLKGNNKSSEEKEKSRKLWGGSYYSIYNDANTIEYLNNLIYIVSKRK